MKLGTIGLFENADGVICCNIIKGDAGIELEELLPPSMRKTAFADAPVGAFLERAYQFFATNAQWDTFWEGVTPGVEIRKKAPRLDIKALKLANGHGHVDYDRLRALYSLIWPYWDKQPPIGLIAHCIAGDFPHEQIARLLELHDRYAKLIDGLDTYFVRLFMPPGLEDQPNGITEKQLLNAFRWLRHPDASGELEQDSFSWQLNLRELGILNGVGIVDSRIAKLAREYIWFDPDREPDFFALKAHLAPHLGAAEVEPKKAASGELSKATRDKLRQQRRKVGKVRRKR